MADGMSGIFPDLVEALRSWTEKNPISTSEIRSSQERRKERTWYAPGIKEKGEPSKLCVYCDGVGHKSFECKTVSGVEDRKNC